MKFSYNWLAGMVPGLKHDPKALMGLITERTAECEGVESSHGDSIIEIDNKSLTHRPDLWGHYGMAREVAAIAGLSLRDPADASLLPTGGASFAIDIADAALCPRYSAVLFENVKVGPSPQWLQDRLASVGLNPINNIVDVTNFVMAELGQPMHAFDADKLSGGTIFVRGASEGERCEALNGETYSLTPQDMVIADASGAIAIAGVIGGAPSAITESTRRILFESANFKAAAVRKTAARIRNRTDASMRFEKSQDPENTTRGLARAIFLMRQICPNATLGGGVADLYEPLPLVAPIAISMDLLRRKLGCVIEKPEVLRILGALEFGVTETAPDILAVTVPSWRATKDISIADDLVEEVGRMVGYGSIAPTAPLVATVSPPANHERRYQNGVRVLLAANGYSESYNYSFLSDETATKFGFDPESLVRVVNPIASDQALMRPSLVPGIYRNIETNLKHYDSFRLFEIGREIHKQAQGLPMETTHLIVVRCAKDDGRAGLMEMKRIAELLVQGHEVRPAAARGFEHPARTADVIWRGETVGRLFEFHTHFVETRAAALDLDLAAVQRLATDEIRYKPLRRYPGSSFDLSIVVPERHLIGELAAMLEQPEGRPEFVGEYRGPGLPEGTRSVTFRFEVWSDIRTLTSAEVSQRRAELVETLAANGIALR